MDLNLLLLSLTVIATVVTVIQTVRNPYANSRGWIIVSTGALGISGLSFLFIPQIAGYLSMAVWVVFAIIPSWAIRTMQKRVYQDDYAGARRLASILRWLHPNIDWSWTWEAARFRAFEVASQGNLAEALDSLRSYDSNRKQIEQDREYLVYWLSQDWHGLLSWLEAGFEQESIEKTPKMIRAYLRALGETGRLDAVVRAFQQYEKQLEKEPVLLHNSHMFLFAFCGQRERVEEIFRYGMLPDANADWQNTWLATADLASGRRETGQELLWTVMRTRNYLVRMLAQQRLDVGVALANETLKQESKSILYSIEQEFGKTSMYMNLTGRRAKQNARGTVS